MVEAGKGRKRRARVIAGDGASREVKLKLVVVVAQDRKRSLDGGSFAESFAAQQLAKSASLRTAWL